MACRKHALPSLKEPSSDHIPSFFGRKPEGWGGYQLTEKISIIFISHPPLLVNCEERYCWLLRWWLDSARDWLDGCRSFQWKKRRRGRNIGTWVNLNSCPAVYLKLTLLFSPVFTGFPKKKGSFSLKIYSPPPFFSFSLSLFVSSPLFFCFFVIFVRFLFFYWSENKSLEFFLFHPSSSPSSSGMISSRDICTKYTNGSRVKHRISDPLQGWNSGREWWAIIIFIIRSQ